MIARKCRAYAARTGEKCTNPAVATVTSGCVHEHMQTGMVCADHQEKILSHVSACGPCSVGSDPHSCPLTGRTEPKVLSNREIAALNAARQITDHLTYGTEGTTL